MNTGTITVRGGDAAAVTAEDAVGAGGGGGGGIVHLISPAGILEGSIDRTEGAGALGGETLSTSDNALILRGGGAGGACWGGGGAGGDITGAGLLTDGFDGNDGAVFTTLADPVDLF